MSLLVSTRRPPFSKPVTGAQLDSVHPLCVNMVACFVMNEFPGQSRLRNLVNPLVGDIVAAGRLVWTPGRWGMGLNDSAGNGLVQTSTSQLDGLFQSGTPSSIV